MALSDQVQSQCSKQGPVKLRHQLAYALPSIPVYLLVGPLAIVNGVYAKYFGLSLTSMATILLVCRLFDAISDPVIGYWSDRYRAQTGSRKPFVVIGGLLLVISCYFLFVPSGTSVNAAYFLVCMLAWYFAFTFFEIPHLSWGAELVAESHGKTTLYGLRALGANFGLLLFYLVPFLPFFSSRVYTPETLYWVVLTAAALMLPTLWFCHRLTPNGSQTVTAAGQSTHQPSLWSLRWEIMNNKPLLIFLAAFISYGIAIGMWFSLQFIFIDVYLKLGEHFALVNIIGLCASSALIPFWVKLSYLIGKKQAWCISLFVYILGIAFASQLMPGEANLSSLVSVMILNYTATSAIGVLVISLLADIIDYGRWKFSTDRAATYFSMLMFSVKTTAALGGALGLGIAGWYDFDPAAITHTSEQIFGLRLAAFGLSIPLLLITLVFVALIPMDNHRHRIIRRRLDVRAIRASQPADQIPSKCSVISKDVALAN